MSQITTPSIRRSGGNLDVYTALLLAAFIVLGSGVVLLAMKNIEHSDAKNSQNGSMFKLVDKR